MKGQTVKGQIKAAAFSGNITLLEFDKPEGYNPGDEVKLHIASHVEADGLRPYDLWWQTCYEIYNADSGEELTYTCHYHSTTPWSSHDMAEDDFWVNLGEMPATSFRAHIDLFGLTYRLPGSAWILCDTKTVRVPLPGGYAPSTFPFVPVILGGLGVGAIMIMARRQK